MAEAWLFINCIYKHWDTVVDKLRKIPNVVEAEATYGVYDVVCKISAINATEITKTVQLIHKVPSVRTIVFLTALEQLGGK